MLKAVIDTNVIVSAALAISGDYWNEARFLFQMMLSDEARFESVTSVAIRYELDDVLSRPHIGFDAEQAAGIITLFSRASRFVDTYGVPMGARDRKDDRVIETALNANADYIVTRDRDLFEPRASYSIAKIGPGIRDRPIHVVNVAAFLSELEHGPRFSPLVIATSQSSVLERSASLRPTVRSAVSAPPYGFARKRSASLAK